MERKQERKSFLVQEILAHYLEKVPARLKIRPAGGTANFNAIVLTGQKRFFLRQRSPRYSEPARITFEAAFQQHLHRFGLPVFSPLVTLTGELAVEKHGRIYQLYPFVPGQRFHHRKAEIESVAGHLAIFHQASQSFQPPVPRILPRYDDPGTALKILEPLKEKATRQQKQEIACLEEHLRRIVRQLPEECYWSLPTTVIHGDWHPVNLLFFRGKVTGIFDFDWSSRQPRLRDVGDGLLFFCSQVDQEYDASSIASLTQPMKLDRRKVALFLRRYQERQPLNQEEQELLPVFMEGRWLFCRIDGLRKVKESQRLTFLLNGIFQPLEEIRKLRFG